MTNHALDKHWGHSLGEGEVLEVKLWAKKLESWIFIEAGHKCMIKVQIMGVT